MSLLRVFALVLAFVAVIGVPSVRADEIFDEEPLEGPRRDLLEV